MRWLVYVATLSVALATTLAAQEAAAPAAPALTAVRVEGLLRVPADNLLQDLPVKAGDPATPNTVGIGQGWLESLGLFIDVTAELNGTQLTYTVRENPLVRAVLIDPAPGLSASAIRNEIGLASRDILSRVRIAADALLITRLYRQIGTVVEVETSFDPAPDQTNTPVDVLFKVNPLSVGRVLVEPLNYVRTAAVQPHINLQPGTPLTVENLTKQQEALTEVPVFMAVDEPWFRRDPALPGDQVEITYPPVEAEQPLLVAETLPYIDVDRLRRWVRFSAVDLNVSVADMEFRLTSDELQAELAAAKAAAAAAPNDPEAAYQVARWSSVAGSGATQDEALQALDTAGRLLEEATTGANTTARNHLRLGQILARIGHPVDAADQFVSALAAQPTGAILAQTYAETVSVLAVLATLGDQGVINLTVDTIRDGAAALANLPTDSDLDTLTRVAQFYFVSLSLARLDGSLRAPLQTDAPLAKWIFARAYDFGGNMPAAGAEESPTTLAAYRDGHHVGKLLTSLAFVIRSIGYEVVGLDAMSTLPDMLDATRGVFLEPGAGIDDDPGLPFFLALNHLLQNDLLAARAAAMRGITAGGQPERLVDLFVITTMETLYSNLTHAASIRELATAIDALSGPVTTGELPAAGHALLLAKLQMANYQSLDPADTTTRAAALTGAAAAAQLTIDRAPDAAGGYWFLGLARLKSDDPGQAVAPYRRVIELQPQNSEAKYALALALVASGQAAEGQQLMNELAAETAPAAQPTPAPAAQPAQLGPVGPPAP
ncbi:MAG TPA: hypothetical protein DCZ72_13060 [Armatimonadetes bacterium]|nr:hypothetical protein [Armatimonadota bacterium]